MDSTTNMAKSVEKLYEKAKKYTETSAELLALNTVDKTADVLSSLTSIVLLVIVVAMFTLFINVGLSLFLGSLLNAYYLGFFIVSAFYFVVALILYVYKDKLIKTPVLRFLIHLKKKNMIKHKNQIELLKANMLLIEDRRQKEYEDLKFQFHETSESFRPINILNQTVKDFGKLPEIKTNLFETILSITGGYFSKKILVGKSNSLVKKILGYVLQYTITNFISKKVSTEKEEE